MLVAAIAVVFALGFAASWRWIAPRVFEAVLKPRPQKAPTSPTGTDTEFSAEVVRVTEILPHPNADKLELVHFEMHTGPAAYEVVSQKGTYKPGDLAAYLSVDCVVPLDRDEFKFLGERLDGKGKTHYRLRAARLRGVFSQGLLVDAPKGFALGDSVAAHYGVEYYRSPEEQDARGPTAPSGRAPKVQPMPVYGVDSLKKMPNLFADGEPIVVTCKIHGTNFRFGWLPRKILGVRIGWKFVVGSHRVIKGDDYKPKYKPENTVEFEAQGGGHWYGSDVWLAAAEKYTLKARTANHKGLVFYGELYGYTHTGGKIQDLTYGRKPEDGPGLAIFDVRRHYGGTWLTFDERWALCGELKLDHVPVFETATTWRGAETLALAEGQSLIAPAQIREGIVVESVEGPRRKAKYVGQGYLLRDEGAKAPNPKKYSVSSDAPRKPQKRVEPAKEAA